MLNEKIQNSAMTLKNFFEGQMTTSEMKDYLLSMNARGIEIEDVIGFTSCMRDYMTAIELPKPLLDVCGTGGTEKERFNISTATAILLGKELHIPIAKHGNYGSLKSNGSFNFLEALGVPYLDTPAGVQSQFDELGYCFIFARNFHPALKSLAPIRQEIGQRTIFNILGPLCNPARPTHQVIGTPSLEIAEKLLVPAIQYFGTDHTLVVVGAGETDELSLSGDNIIFDITKEGVKKSVCNVESWHNLTRIVYPVHSVEKNAETFKLLQEMPHEEKICHPLYHHIAINAGAALYCFGKANSIEYGYKTFKENL